MRRVNSTLLAAAIAVAVSSTVQAQWPQIVPPGVPKNADGTVNLNAPAPRLPDGKPDLSGIWNNGPRREKPGEAEAAGRPPLSAFQNVGANMVGGLPHQPWALELRDKRIKSNHLDNPNALCMPQGPLQYLGDPQPFQIFHVPNRVVFIYETNYGRRQIYMDGRALPKQGEPIPNWNGYSVGRWEGDTLVVTTNNFRGVEGGHGSDGWLDGQGNPFSDALTVTERFRRPNYGNMEIDVTIDDPKAYTRPFTVRIEKRIEADGWEMLEFICHENQTFDTLTGR